MMKIRFYKTPAGNEPARDFLKDQGKEDRKKIGGDLLRVQETYPKVGMPLVEPVGKKIWAIRINLPGHWVRIFYIVWQKSIVLLHAVLKKTNKLDQDDLEIAQERAKDLRDGDQK